MMNNNQQGYDTASGKGWPSTGGDDSAGNDNEVTIPQAVRAGHQLWKY